MIDAIGRDVEGWTVGSRVGVGWFAGSCGYCGHCRRGDSFACENIHGVTGMTRDGGYATHMLALTSALVRVPDSLNSVDSAPLLCAGMTTFNALRNCGARPGDLVAIHGVGGLGHLGVQFAARQGFRTVPWVGEDLMIFEIDETVCVRRPKSRVAALVAPAICKTPPWRHGRR